MCSISSTVQCVLKYLEIIIRELIINQEVFKCTGVYTEFSR